MPADLESSEDLEYSDRDRQELLDSPENWSRIHSLPPLPERHIWTMRRESAVGCTLVLILVSLLVSLTQGVALAPGAAAPRGLIWAALVLIYTEAAVALVCLLGLLFGNPGELKRSPQTCFPMPEPVADRLSRGESLDGLANVSSDGRTYCEPLPGLDSQQDRRRARSELGPGLGPRLGLAVQGQPPSMNGASALQALPWPQPSPSALPGVRCLVWRRDELNIHHCSTCNRCVCHFDHHCGVFGRCIAGDGFGGNMGYFKTIIGMAAAGCVRGCRAELASPAAPTA